MSWRSLKQCTMSIIHWVIHPHRRIHNYVASICIQIRLWIRISCVHVKGRLCHFGLSLRSLYRVQPRKRSQSHQLMQLVHQLMRVTSAPNQLSSATRSMCTLLCTVHEKSSLNIEHTYVSAVSGGYREGQLLIRKCLYSTWQRPLG